eukprot:17461-Chlamydomonas_euryale.AAC.1
MPSTRWPSGTDTAAKVTCHWSHFTGHTGHAGHTWLVTNHREFWPRTTACGRFVAKLLAQRRGHARSLFQCLLTRTAVPAWRPHSTPPSTPRSPTPFTA